MNEFILEYGRISILISLIIAVSGYAVFMNRKSVSNWFKTIIETAIKNIQEKQGLEDYMIKMAKDHFTIELEELKQEVKRLRESDIANRITIGELQEAQKRNKSEIKALKIASRESLRLFIESNKRHKIEVKKLEEEKYALSTEIELLKNKLVLLNATIQRLEMEKETLSMTLRQFQGNE